MKDLMLFYFEYWNLIPLSFKAYMVEVNCLINKLCIVCLLISL